MTTAVALAAWFPTVALGLEPTPSQLRFFENQVRPVLVSSCFKCHGPRKQESGLRLDSRAGMLQGGLRGAVIIPGDASRSLLVDFIRYQGEVRMPPTKALDASSIVALEKWIDMGAPWPEEGPSDDGAGGGVPGLRAGAITDAERGFWSFQPLADVKPPTLDDAQGWSRSPVDRFILARLQAEGIEPVGFCDKRTWIRRLTFDLTGLPPTPEEIDAFLEDDDPDADSRLVDRLLVSPAYGERWGRHWLDVARYADTAGETADYPLPDAYRYRNYVIDSFNADKPYHDFVREQIAGDLLAADLPLGDGVSDGGGTLDGSLREEDGSLREEDGSLREEDGSLREEDGSLREEDGSLREEDLEEYADRVLGTGLIALSRRFGYDSERYHYMTIQDTLDTVGQAFLGLSLGCARCHDHKFDPVTRQDYYALYGIFASTRYPFPGSEQKGAKRSYVPLLPPEMAVPSQAAFDAKLARLAAEIKELKGGVPRVSFGSLLDIDGDFELQESARGGSDGTPVDPWQFAGGVLLEKFRSSPYSNVYRPGELGVHLPGDAGRNALWVRTRPLGGAANAWSEQTARRLYFNIDFRSSSTAPEDKRKAPGNARPLRRLADSTGAKARGAYRFFLGSGPGDRPAVEIHVRRGESPGEAELALGHGAEMGAWTFLAPDSWYNLHLVLDLETRSYSGSLVGPQQRVEFTVKEFRPGWSGRIDHVLVDEKSGHGGIKPHLDVDNLALRDVPFDSPELEKAGPVVSLPGAASPKRATSIAKAGARTVEADKSGTTQLVVADDSSVKPSEDEVKRREKLLAGKKEELVALLRQGPHPKAYGVVEGYYQDVRVHERGDPLRLGEEVPRRWLEIFGARRLPRGAESSGRRELAEWLTPQENPLSARVIVNRLWEHHFGHGLVRTENDFGSRGERPTHPELLDYLAQRLLASAGSLKSVHREIVLSSTYRLSSATAPDAALRDPEVRWRWRFEPRRVEAEVIRDSLLLLGGQLERAMGGPHPFPTIVEKTYSQHEPFRAVYPSRKRSVYLMTQRTKRHPYLGLFDAPDRNASIAKRAITTVPTQTLFFMNSPLVHEQALEFSRRVCATAEGDSARIVRAFRLALGRFPTDAEFSEMETFLTVYRGDLDGVSVPAEGQPVPAEGQPVPAEGQAGERRDVLAFAALARTLFARNEFIYID